MKECTKQLTVVIKGDDDVEVELTATCKGNAYHTIKAGKGIQHEGDVNLYHAAIDTPVHWIQ